MRPSRTAPPRQPAAQAKPPPKPAPPPDPPISLEAYLEGESRGIVRRELIAGRRVVWPVPTGNRLLIGEELGRRLRAHLRNDASWVFTGGIRIEVPEADAIYYADAAVAVDPTYVEHTFVRSPILIVDIFSGSRPGVNPKRRLQQYLTLPSLQQYLLLAPHRPSAMLHTREEDDSWTTDTLGGADVLALTSVSLNFYLDALYVDLEDV